MIMRNKLISCALLSISLGFSTQSFAKLTQQQAENLVKEAYIFGYPMVDSYRVQYSYFVDKESAEYKGEWNKVHNVARVFTPQDTAIQTPNSDTPYSFVGADLRTEPLVITVPDIEKKRYYSIQMIDMYTHNFSYIGSRATSNNAANFLLVGPNWKGEKPKGIKDVIRSETDLAFLLYRTQLFSEKDIDNVKNIQASYKVTPLSSFLNIKAPPAAPKIEFIQPLSLSEQKSSPQFFNIMNFTLQYANVHPDEKKLIESFKQIGVVPGKTFDYDSLDPVVQAAIPKGIEKAWAALQDRKVNFLDKGLIKSSDGFGNRKHIDGRYLDRMMGAVFGIYGNSEEEAIYPTYFVDATGLPLDGKNKYQLTFPKGQLPPAKSFWSLTMYTMPESLLYENKLNRYLINSSMEKSLVKNKDGSITLYLQNEEPLGDKKNNWLPAPAGPFASIMRIYWPEKTVIDGIWKAPKLIKVSK
ncbi:DUF1254 domain-containing protein [Acinetobacter junii]|uniref:DUF1254 domain-containing protein n=1 Tax=Acinetobacter junii TaxID=40215 RepID=UPI001F382F7C|nr:DUF1254 domain-containing protein [Acinetobacter junii]